MTGVDLARLLAAPVEDGEAGVEAGAAPRIGAAVDGRGERDLRGRVEGGEGVRPRGISRDAMRRRDRHQPSAGREHREGRADVMQIDVMADALDPGARREGRVHQDHGGTQLGQPVTDGLRVVAGDGASRKEAGEEAGADGGELVEVQRAGVLAERELRHDGQHAGARRGFEHHVAGPDHRGLQRGVGERQRRRELLIPELLLGAPRLGGLERRQGLQHAQHGGGAARTGAGLAPHGAAVALEEQHQRRLGRLVGVLPEPGAVRVGGAEGPRHRLAQRAGIERPAGFEDRQQGAGRGQQRGGRGPGLGLWGESGFGDRGRGDGGGRSRGRGRRRVGVEHGAGSDDEGAGRRRARGSPPPLRPACGNALPQRSVRPARKPFPVLLGGGARGGGQAARPVMVSTPPCLGRAGRCSGRRARIGRLPGRA